MPSFFRRKSKADTYREPMQVKEYFIHAVEGAYPICPRCHTSFDIEYQAYCASCGQCLGWDEYENATQKVFESAYSKV